MAGLMASPHGSDLPGVENRLPSTVLDLAYTGESILWLVRLADGSVMQVRQPLTEGLTTEKPAPGTQVTVAWRSDASILLAE
jgi:hypothetical protein